MLELRDISAGYGEAQVLRDISLHVDAGEILCLMGRNGAGKTTTLKTIMGLLPALSGEVLVDGENVSARPAHEVPLAGIGYVPQGRRLFAGLTVAQNLDVGLRARDSDASVKDKVLELFPRLKERLGQAAQTLSGGEQQMLAIGRALMTNPRLLILDEATEGLAPIIRQEIWAALGRLKSETQVSILVIDKSLKELARIADSAVILERGTTVWSGQMDALTPDLSERYIGV